MSRLRAGWQLAVIALMAACASTPLHYHTLVPAAGNAVPAPSSRPYGIVVERVTVPADVDRVEMIVRRSDGEIALIENEVWLAPLADELKSALLVEIQRRLASSDPPGQGRVLSQISIGVDIQRFESAPGRYARIEATWHLRARTVKDELVLSCSTATVEPVGKGYVALVQGHQRAVALIGDQIALAMQELAANRTAACPAA